MCAYQSSNLSCVAVQGRRRRDRAAAYEQSPVMEVTACSSGRLGPTGVLAEPLRRIQKGQQGLNRASGEEKWQR